MTLDYNFNPRSPYGERLIPSGLMQHTGLFQSTLPVRGATLYFLLNIATFEFQSTLPVRGATADAQKPMLVTLFQSTLPVRGATICPICGEPVRVFQSTLPVRGATPHEYPGGRAAAISIHAPRTGSDFPLPSWTR